MACAANYAWVNRSSMTFLCRQVRCSGAPRMAHRSASPDRAFFCSCAQAFAKMFNSTPDDLDMHVVYDVSHNIAKARSLGYSHCRCGTGMTRTGRLRSTWWTVACARCLCIGRRVDPPCTRAVCASSPDIRD